MTVLMWGVPSESPVRMVAEALAAIGADTVAVPPDPVNVEVELGVDSRGRLDGGLRVDGRTLEWPEITAVYVRPVEPDLAPRLRNLDPAAPALRHARVVHDALIGFTEVAALDGRRVANRLSAMASNMSKPFQAQTVGRHGFAIPDTLITDSAEELLEFSNRHDSIVYKSTSGVRSIVTTFDAVADRWRLARLRWCPVQFQERIEGPDVRVHVIGEQVYAAIVQTTAVDYRYARRQVGEDARLQSYELPDVWAERCVSLSADLCLPFAGIDLKLAPDGRVICFEVNPSPGYPWYEVEAGLPISDAVARWLTAA
jgi:hypothetical protein